jgi:hypothetical protein
MTGIDIRASLTHTAAGLLGLVGLGEISPGLGQIVCQWSYGCISYWQAYGPVSVDWFGSNIPESDVKLTWTPSYGTLL